MSFFRKQLDRFRTLIDLARRERASPLQVGVATAVGIFACFAPVIGLHLWLALLGATLLRVNRLWAGIAAQVPSLFGLLRPAIVFVEIEVGRRARTGQWIALSLDQAIAEAPSLLVDWMLGALLVGAAVALPAGFFATLVTERRVRASRAELTRTPAPPLPPTSGSPP